MSRPIEFAYPFDNHRTTPMEMIGPFTDALMDGGVDYLWLWDELSGWFPGQLWRPEVTPAAAVIDSNATYDPFVQGAFALAHNNHANLRLSTDAVRSQPAELLRRVLTLANGTDGNVVLAIGAGELRQTKPFGYKRSEGLKRLEDVFALIRELYDAEEPFSHEGNFWNYRNAFIGQARPERKPEFWALGGGPILLDIAARYADGFEVASPQSTQTAEQFAEIVKDMREKVEGLRPGPGRLRLRHLEHLRLPRRPGGDRAGAGQPGRQVLRRPVRATRHRAVAEGRPGARDARRLALRDEVGPVRAERRGGQAGRRRDLDRDVPPRFPRRYPG